jgi:hypothetical protein
MARSKPESASTNSANAGDAQPPGAAGRRARRELLRHQAQSHQHAMEADRPRELDPRGVDAAGIDVRRGPSHEVGQVQEGDLARLEDRADRARG